MVIIDRSGGEIKAFCQIAATRMAADVWDRQTSSPWRIVFSVSARGSTKWRS